MQKSILKDFPDADIDVSIIWIPMLPTDNEAAAKKIAATIRDPRVTHYYDADRKAGEAFKHGVITPDNGVAWDVYLFYKPGQTWDDHPPKPADYLHQLSGGKRASAGQFRTGAELVKGLHDSMAKLLHDK